MVVIVLASEGIIRNRSFFPGGKGVQKGGPRVYDRSKCQRVPFHGDGLLSLSLSLSLAAFL